jgi:HTH-type transcriptional regulator / antitoxin HigA
MRSILDDADYKATLKSVSELINTDPKLGTLDADRLEALGTLLQAYEARHFPMESLDAIEAIRFHKKHNS